MDKPGWIPYLWIIGLGVFLIVLGLLFLLQGGDSVVLPVILFVTGPIMILLGFAERKRGAPRV